MSRRRRQKNPLLMRCILISIAANIVILPVLAYFGAFKEVAAAFRKPVEIIVTPPPADKDKAVTKKEPRKQPKLAAKGPSAKRSGAPKGKPLSQRVVAATASPGSNGAGSGPSVVNPDKGVTPGTLPTAPTGGGKNGNASGAGPVASAKPAPQPTAEPKPAIIAAPASAPKPHIPVVTEVAATYSPEPAIPDDLRDADFDSKVTAQVMVNAEGTPEDVKIVQSSGNDELDAIARETAKKWRFKPATRDGAPVESRVMLHIEFEVQ